MSKTRKIAFMGLLFAVAIVLSFVENIIVIPTLPGVKLGLSNVAVMYCLFFVDYKASFALTALKAIFVALTRGIIAGAMSISGGIVSILAMLLLLRFKHASKLIISVAGAVFHNLGQLMMSSFILKTEYVFYYIPVMVISGVVVGVSTGLVLKIILPAMEKMEGKRY